MAEFVIHSIPGSPYGRAPMLALEEKGLPWRLAPIAPGTLKSPEHLARHPFGRIPAVDHGEFRLYEAQAILRYIDRVAPQPALTPADPKAAARMDQLMNIVDWYLFQGVANVIVFHRVVGPRLMGLTPDEAACAEAMPRAETVFAELSAHLGDKPYLVGDTLTLADLHLAPQLDMFAEAPEWAQLTAKRPNLAAWLERMRARPSMQATTWERLGNLAQAA